MEESGHFALAVYNALRAVVSGGSCVFGRALPCSNDGEEPHGSSPFPSCHPKEQNFLHPPFEVEKQSFCPEGERVHPWFPGCISETQGLRGVLCQ